MATDYTSLGFKAGLEIHQQLDTKKLFCNCPSLLRKDTPEFTITRKLHAVAGESGDIDKAAQYQHALDKTFFYEGYDTTCLVEVDEEPPYEINQEALTIALQVSQLLHCTVFPITQIMRKTVIDGSNTGGFQRTVLLARDGYLETSNGRIGIASLCLEEDSARIVEKTNTHVTYRLDRLGIPLIEIATEPDITTPLQAKEVALALGDLLRSCKIKRGLGTIRQDVNVSIKGGKRVEIKGVQDPDLIQKTLEKEVVRQQALLSKGNYFSSEVRQALPDGDTQFLRPMPGAARMYPETDLPLLRLKKSFLDAVKKRLPKLNSEIKVELQKKGLSQDYITLLFKEDKLEAFKELLLVYNHPTLVAKVLLVHPKDIMKKKGLSVEDTGRIFSLDVLSTLLEMVAKGKFDEGHIKPVLESVADGLTLQEACAQITTHSDGDLEERVLALIKEKPGLTPHAYMGLLMKELRGKVSGKVIMDMLQHLLK